MIVRHIGIMIVQTIGGLISTAVVTLILGIVIEAIVPYDYGMSMCEYFCPGYAWFAILIAAPLALITSVWLIGKFFGQRGNWWLTGFGTLIGVGLVLLSGYWAGELFLPPILDIVVPVFAVPLLASVMYQLSCLSVKQSGDVEVKP